MLAENPKNSLMRATPEAKRLQKVENMQFSNYDACAYAGTRNKKQALLHNMSPCSELAAVCHHAHAHDEWTPTKSTAKTKSPTAEEAEYTAAFCWSAGVCMMMYFFNEGITKLRMTHFPMIRCETGDRVAWKNSPQRP